MLRGEQYISIQELVDDFKLDEVEVIAAIFKTLRNKIANDIKQCWQNPRFTRIVAHTLGDSDTKMTKQFHSFDEVLVQADLTL